MSDPFKKIVAFTLGDLVAKAASFLAFVYLARTLGVAAYGTLEFALAVVTYLAKVADGGLEMWAIRAAARGEPVERLVSRVMPLRFLVGFASFAGLLSLVPALPDYPSLRTLVAILGCTVLLEMCSLRWVLMGRERLGRVAVGSIAGQLVFAVGAVAVVSGPEALLLIAFVRIGSDLFTAGYFFWLFLHIFGRRAFSFSLRGSRQILGEALPFGLTHLLGLATYSLDTVLLGFLTNTESVGLYNAAYRPVTVCLAAPLAYFQGLYPVLSRSFEGSLAEFKAITEKSLRLAVTAALPLAIGAVCLAEPILDLVFGAEYIQGAQALQLLGCSGALVMTRGTFRQGLLAAGFQKLDLRCSALSVALNLVLNLILIPAYGIVGAAAATLMSELAWVTLAGGFFHHYLVQLSPIRTLWRTGAAASAMYGYFLVFSASPWAEQTAGAVGSYLVVLAMTGEFRANSPLRRWNS